MCRVVYLGSRDVLAAREDHPLYPCLDVRRADDAPAHVVASMRAARYFYELRPTSLCGCYFRIKSQREIEEDIEAAAASPQGLAWSYAAVMRRYPGLDPANAERRFEADCRQAVVSFGTLVRGSTPVELFATPEDREPVPLTITGRVHASNLARLDAFDPGESAYWLVL